MTWSCTRELASLGHPPLPLRIGRHLSWIRQRLLTTDEGATQRILHPPPIVMNWSSAFASSTVQGGRDADRFTIPDPCIKSLSNNWAREC